MAKTVNTGWRNVAPGRCSCCGDDDGWDCDGRGTVYCECQTCPGCGEYAGHGAGCPEVASDDEDCDHSDVTTDCDGTDHHCDGCGAHTGACPENGTWGAEA